MTRKKPRRVGVTRRDFLKRSASVGAVVGAAGAGVELSAQGRRNGWNREADVIVIGAGATGLPAAIAAREQGASVIVLDANSDVGGHAILSGGNVALGGGTSAQKKYGIADSPDLVFNDLTDWSVVQANGFPDYRYNDREIIRAFADHSASTYEFLVAHGVMFVDKAPDNGGAISAGNSAPRANHAAPMQWPQIQTGRPVPEQTARTGSSGVGLIRPLEASARKLGVEILLNHRMTGLVRENARSGRVTGVTASANGAVLRFRARKAVVIATGGSSSNVNFRRMFDPRLTEEYCGVAGEPYTPQDASGELAAMAVGGALWGAFNQTGEFGFGVTKAGRIGCQYGYSNLMWAPTSPLFHLARATGLRVRDYQNVILVNRAGSRFYDETKGQFTSNGYNGIKNYLPHSWRNAARQDAAAASNFIPAALAGVPGEAVNGGGPIWAVFDADAVTREEWNVEPPFVDKAAGFFFSAGSIAELEKAVAGNKYQRSPIPAGALASAIARYNGFVDSGTDEDFAKPSPKFKVQTPPFHAAWATPVIHDSRVGLRITAKCEVVDMDGKIIPGLYCGGESAGGFSIHGLARCTVQGRLAGMNAAAQT